MKIDLKSKTFHKIIKSVLFILIGLIILGKVTDILENPLALQYANGTGLELVHTNKDKYNIITVGTSVGVANIANQQLYEAYGISAVSIASPAQPAFITYYTLLDALESQKPDIVIYDTKNLFYDNKFIEDTLNSEYYLHAYVDKIKSSAIKKNILDEVQYYTGEFDYWDYYSTLYYSHDNWKNLSEDNYLGYNEPLKNINGNYVLFDMDETIKNYYQYINYDASRTEEGTTIPAVNINALQQITDLCKEKGIELILITSYIDFTQDKADAISQFCHENDLLYLNIFDHLDKINLNPATDFESGAHMNLNGTTKWTDYIGDYIVSNFTLADKGDNVPSASKEVQDIYQKQLQFMNDKINLISALDFYSYMEELIAFDLDDYAIFISIYDEGTYNLSDYGMALFNQLGLKTNLLGQYRASYAAVVDGMDIKEEFSLDEEVNIKQKYGKLTYNITSGGLTSDSDISIKINGTEYAQELRGINIVVYNKTFDEIVNVASFDTHASDNPKIQRLYTPSNTIEQLQTQIEPNVWINVE